MSERDLYEEIARVAYDLWEKTGCIHGCDIEHWCQAEQIVIARIMPAEEESQKVEESQKKVASRKKTPAKTGTRGSGTAKKTRKPSKAAKKA